MPRLIDEGGLKKAIWEYTDKYGHIEMTITRFNILLERNRVDAVEVVRCIDCIHYKGLAECDVIGDCMGTDGYCAWGERREEE